MSVRPVQWTRCECGKVLCDSPADARRKAEAQQFLCGVVDPYAIYECRRAPGVWHWTRNDAPCGCGRRANSQSKVGRKVEEINSKLTGDVVARPYQCPHGGHHWAWYVKGRKFRYCDHCDLPAYPDPHTAQAVAQFRAEAHDRPQRVYRCAASRWHLKAGTSPCDTAGVHQGTELWVIHEGDTQRWWKCCGEIDVSV